LFDTPATPCVVQMQNRRLNTIQIPRKPSNKCALSPAAPFLYTHTHTHTHTHTIKQSKQKGKKKKKETQQIFFGNACG
jgi:hypothetical protein